MAAKTSAERDAKYRNLRKAAGLSHPKIWVHPDEIQQLRNIAAELPKTKEALSRV